METWTKVLVYGTFDGFTFSTDELTRINVVLDGGEIVEVPEDFVVSADQMVNKYKIKLKDVIARIENFDLATKAVWINEILNKLGSDYGLHKYYAGYKQGKFDGAMEREKVTVKQFVADWIEYCKTNGIALGYALYCPGQASDKKAYDWIVESLENQETFARAWLDGYTVEKEKRYLVKVKGVNDYGCYLNKGLLSKEYFWESKAEVGGCRTKHTRKQLEDDDFGWVFDCEGIEIEEVE